MSIFYTLFLGALLHTQVAAPVRPEVSTDSIRKDSVTQERADTARKRPTVLAPTVITGTGESQQRTESSATIDVVNRTDLERTRPSHPSGIMNRVPGVHISELSAEGHSTAIRQPINTKPMYLYLEDGIPTRATGFFNHNALYEVNLPQSGGIEILKGPGTALYGSDAIGGVINVLSKAPPARPTIEASLEGGSYGWARLLTSGGLRNNRYALRGDLNVTRSTGWRADAPYNRQSGTLRWDVIAPHGWFIKTLATATAVNQYDVPTVSQNEFRSNSPANTAPIAFREARAGRLSVSMEKTNEVTHWSFTPYARRNVMNLLPSWQISYNPQVWYQKNTSAGMAAKVRRDLAPFNARIIAGIDLDYSPGHFTANNALLDTTPATSETPMRFLSYSKGARQYDYDVTYHNMSPYIQAETQPVSRLRIDAGLRYDRSGYKYKTLLSPVSTGNHRIPASTSVKYDRLTPKIGASLYLAQSANLYGSFRQGFRAPSQGQLFQQNSADNTIDLKPVLANSYEVGLRGEWAQTILYSVSAYEMVITNDIISYRTPSNTTEATNAGKTRHRGIETALTFIPHPAIKVDAAYSRTQQKYIEWNPSSTVSYSGNLIEQAPRDLGNLLITYSPAVFGGGRVAAEVVNVGKYAMNPENTQHYSGYTIVHLHANYILPSGGELFVRASNILNKTFAETATYTTFQQHQYTPGSPRSIYAGARYRWIR